MKRRIILPAVALMGMTVWGCGEGGSQLTDPATPPEVPTTKTPVTATIGVVIVVSSGSQTQQGDIIRVRNRGTRGPVTGDIEGTFDSVANFDFSATTFDGTASGTGLITTDDGDWDGTWSGRLTAGLLSGTMQFEGAGGLEGKELTGTFVETGAFTGTFTFTGDILTPVN